MTKKHMRKDRKNRGASILVPALCGTPFPITTGKSEDVECLRCLSIMRLSHRGRRHADAVRRTLRDPRNSKAAKTADGLALSQRRMH